MVRRGAEPLNMGISTDLGTLTTTVTRARCKRGRTKVTTPQHEGRTRHQEAKSGAHRARQHDPRRRARGTQRLPLAVLPAGIHLIERSSRIFSGSPQRATPLRSRVRLRLHTRARNGIVHPHVHHASPPIVAAIRASVPQRRLPAPRIRLAPTLTAYPQVAAAPQQRVQHTLAAPLVEQV